MVTNRIKFYEYRYKHIVFQKIKKMQFNKFEFYLYM